MLASSSSSPIILVFLLVVLFSPTFSQDRRKWFRAPKGLGRRGEDTRPSSRTDKGLDHRGEDTKDVRDLFETCKPIGRKLLIRKADYQSQASQRLCTNGSHTSSPDIECACNKQDRGCTASFSLRTLSRIYSAVDAGKKMVWDNFVKDFRENGNCTITYECIEHDRGPGPCVQGNRSTVTRIAFFPTAILKAKDQQCQMNCIVTRDASDMANHEKPYKWDHHFVLLNTESEHKNYAEYQIVFYSWRNTTWERFKPSRLEEEIIHAKRRDILKLNLRFVFQNVSEVLRFWLEFRDTSVNVHCEEITKTTSTATTSTTPPSTEEPDPQNTTLPSTGKPDPHNTAGITAHVYVVPPLLLVLLIVIVAVVCLVTKRHGKRPLNEEASQLLATPPSFPNLDPDSSHHPQEASNPSPSQGRHVTGSGSDDDNPYDCLDHRGSQRRRGRRREESDDYSHVVRCTSDGAYARCQREAGRRHEVLDNPYDHTFMITD